MEGLIVRHGNVAEHTPLHTCTPQLSFHESITSNYLLSRHNYKFTVFLRGLKGEVNCGHLSYRKCNYFITPLLCPAYLPLREASGDFQIKFSAFELGGGLCGRVVDILLWILLYFFLNSLCFWKKSHFYNGKINIRVIQIYFLFFIIIIWSWDSFRNVQNCLY